jgi:hypothetical protein
VRSFCAGPIWHPPRSRPVRCGPRRRRQRGFGLYYLVCQLDTIDELAVFRQRLVDAGARVGGSSHGATTASRMAVETVATQGV